LVVEADFYRVRLRFKRLFADPMLFEDQGKVIERYLFPKNTAADRSAIFQITESISPSDSSGKTPEIAGTARYVHDRRVIRSEYLENVTLSLEYVDFGSGLRPDDHKTRWQKQTWGPMSFNLEEIQSERFKIEIPPVPELYDMISTKADPTALVDVELPELHEKLFRPTVNYLETRLKLLAKQHNHNIDIYVARDLLPEEKQALEKRLTRPSKDFTIYVLMSKSASHPTI